MPGNERPYPSMEASNHVHCPAPTATHQEKQSQAAERGLRPQGGRPRSSGGPPHARLSPCCLAPFREQFAQQTQRPGSGCPSTAVLCVVQAGQLSMGSWGQTDSRALASRCYPLFVGAPTFSPGLLSERQFPSASAQIRLPGPLSASSSPASFTSGLAPDPPFPPSPPSRHPSSSQSAAVDTCARRCSFPWSYGRLVT